jgi:predicted TIM-barrel fold metal-dependent hydrolase
MIAGMKETLAASPVAIVFDHFGGARPELGVQQPGFGDLVELVRSGKAYVKISVSGGPRGDYSGFLPLAQALVSANADRVIWGTNWPHPNSGAGKPLEVTPLFQVDNGLVLNQLPLWVPDATVRKKILVDNPARLYSF